MPKFVRPSRLKSSLMATAIAATLLAGLSAHAGPVAAPISQVHKMLTVDAYRQAQQRDCALPVLVLIACVGAGIPMTSGGGPIESAPAVYIVRWGWTTDPSGELAYQENFFNGIGGSTWGAIHTQYCDHTTDVVGLSCSPTAHFVGNQSGVLQGTWDDNVNPVPSSPTDAQIIAEATRAATHFGKNTSALNAQVQYIIDTPKGKSTSGFNSSWCAYHGSANTTNGVLAYTNFPYITDAGTTCGQNFVNSGTAGLRDGISIVAGHEFSETATDVDAASGWFDEIGAENGDKCAWIDLGPGAMTNITLSTGKFAVQSMWSNNANSGLGGCVTYYAGPNDQH